MDLCGGSYDGHYEFGKVAYFAGQQGLILVMTDQNARAVALQILTDVEQGVYADRALASGLAKGCLDARDARLVTELVNGMLRMRGHIDWVLNSFVQGGTARQETRLRTALRLGAYQILFLDRIPASAAVDETVSLVKTFGRQEKAGFANAVLRKVARRAFSYPDRDDDEVTFISVVHSHPAWLVRRWIGQLGADETEQLCQANNRAPGVTVRVNRLKVSVEQAADYLRGRGFAVRPGSYASGFLHIMKGGNLVEDEAFRKGWFFVQDESAGLPAVLLDPQPGDQILDMCSAPGGKTTHLAELMDNEGLIVAADINRKKLALVEENCGRLGIGIVRTVEADGRNLAEEPFDRVLVDAPCSGTGVLGRRADARWKKKERQIADLAVLQGELLNKASRLLKKEGVLVFSTCSLEPEEGPDVLDLFLQGHPDMMVDDARCFVNPALVDVRGCVRTYPHRHDMDGFFVVRLKRKH